MKGVRNQPFSLLILIAHLFFVLASLFYTVRGEEEKVTDEERRNSHRPGIPLASSSLDSLHCQSVLFFMSDSLFQRLITGKRERERERDFIFSRFSFKLLCLLSYVSLSSHSLHNQQQKGRNSLSLSLSLSWSWSRTKDFYFDIILSRFLKKEGSILPSFLWLTQGASFSSHDIYATWTHFLLNQWHHIQGSNRATRAGNHLRSRHSCQEMGRKEKRNGEEQDIAGVISDAWKYPLQ